MRIKLMVWLVMIMLLAAAGWPQEADVADTVQKAPPPDPPTDVVVNDHPNDAGHSIDIAWDPPINMGTGEDSVIAYRVMRAPSPDGPWDMRVLVASEITDYEDAGVGEEESDEYLPNDSDFYYKVVAETKAGGEAESAVAGPVQASEQWYNFGKTVVLIAVVLFTAFTLFFIRRARKGADLYVRPLAGIDAVDEAIGRATEMGKPILYIMGLGTAADIATIASFTILSRVAKKVAEYQTSLIVPCYDPIVMTVAQDTVKNAYADAGRPDAYNEDIVFFLTNQQFAYVGAVNGIMIRQKPATNFYLGRFYAESLILAETGTVSGAIQIAGTDEVTQLPFFVVACDYTLIGEELYAASAYLGREPVLLGTLKAQDYGKALVIIFSLLGFLAAVLGWTWFTDLFIVGE